MSAQTQWFYDPEMLPGGPKCPDCRSTESPRLVTFDGIDSGTGEQIHEERFRCSCGFVGEENEFQAGVGVDGDTPRSTVPVAARERRVDRYPLSGSLPSEGSARWEEPRPVIEAKRDSRVRTGTPASSSPRIERGTDAEADAPF